MGQEVGRVDRQTFGVVTVSFCLLAQTFDSLSGSGQYVVTKPHYIAHSVFFVTESSCFLIHVASII